MEAQMLGCFHLDELPSQNDSKPWLFFLLKWSQSHGKVSPSSTVAQVPVESTILKIKCRLLYPFL